jgi:hypothetical protein
VYAVLPSGLVQTKRCHVAETRALIAIPPGSPIYRRKTTINVEESAPPDRTQGPPGKHRSSQGRPQAHKYLGVPVREITAPGLDENVREWEINPVADDGTD